MVVTGICFVSVTALVKLLGTRIPATEAAFLRYLLGLVFLAPFILQLFRTRFDRRAWALFAGRGIAHSVAVVLWFFAMARIPIADVTAMNYLSPVYVTIGAALFFGEKLAARRITAIALALIGAAIILRPGFRELSPGHIAMLFTALFFAIGYLITKQLVADVSPTVVVALLSITVSIGLLPFALAVWVTPTLDQLVLLFGVAVFATAGHYSMTLAFAAAPLSVTQPVTFLQLIWATSLGALFFGEAVDAYVVLGGALIVASISFMSWREARAKRMQVTPAVPETKG